LRAGSNRLPQALWFDVLCTHTVLALSRQSELFGQQVESQRRGSQVGRLSFAGDGKRGEVSLEAPAEPHRD
jgi:hypothetical protein